MSKKKPPLKIRYSFEDGENYVLTRTEEIYRTISQDVAILGMQIETWDDQAAHESAENRLRFIAEAAAEKELRLLRNPPTVSDAQIDAALKANRGQVEASLDVGISDRQIRKRRNKKRNP